jgi:hypothetical protein
VFDFGHLIFLIHTQMWWLFKALQQKISKREVTGLKYGFCKFERIILQEVWKFVFGCGFFFNSGCIFAAVEQNKPLI